MTDDLRVALLGYGLAGRVFHRPLIAATPGLRLTTVVSADPTRTAQAKADTAGIRVVPDTETLFAGRLDVDLVVVASANAAHVAQARLAIEHRLPVVVDKPMAPDAPTARDLADRAEAAGVPLITFHNRRWDGDLLTVAALLRDDRLGRVHRLESRFERWRPVPRDTWRENGPPEALPGVLFDLAPHLVDQAQVLLGPVTSVYAEARTVRPGSRAHDDAFLALTHRSGAVSHLWCSAAAAAQGPRFRVLGDSGGYLKYGLDHQEQQLRTGADPAAPGWGIEPPETWGRLLPGAGGDGVPVPTAAGAWPQFYAAVERCVRHNGANPVPPQDVIATTAVIDAARASAASGGVVSVATG
ncbi:MAG: oxidoreductase [Actinomycetota bacterium]|nr:MAG: oxidoreductase [Actinomycetota bacterium]